MIFNSYYRQMLMMHDAKLREGEARMGSLEASINELSIVVKAAEKLIGRIFWAVLAAIGTGILNLVSQHIHVGMQ